jgi:hypothetical protein
MSGQPSLSRLRGGEKGHLHAHSGVYALDVAVARRLLDRLLRLAMLFCGRCNMDDQFTLGIDLMIRGLDSVNDPGC